MVTRVQHVSMMITPRCMTPRVMMRVLASEDRSVGGYGQEQREGGNECR